MSESAASPHHDRIPALRPVEVIPFEEDGESLLLLNDRQGVASDPLVVRAAILPFLQLFDGRHTILDLQAAFTRAVGRLITSEEAQQFVQQLDAALLLDSEPFRQERGRIVRSLRDAPSRAAAHAARAYPAESAALRRLLDGRKAEHARSIEPVPPARLRAVIAPHIDYERGARCYARVYRCLEDAGPGATGAPDVYVLIGTAHAGLERPYSVLAKAFATPLVELPADMEVAADLQQAIGEPSDADLLVHRSEHSLELTATYLAYALGGRPAPILPILCGVGYAELEAGGGGARQAIDGFLAALRAALERHGRRACFVAAADLAHVGPRFGDGRPVADDLLSEVEAADRRALAAAAAVDAEGFVGAIAGVEDRHRVCGLGAIYSVLRLLEDQGQGPPGRLIDYGQAPADDRSQCVTFAGMVFEAAPAVE